MIDYRKMSDFEINKRVAIATGHKQLSSLLGWQGLQDGEFNAVMVRGPMKIGGFDPCNNPADAWPIILENRISLMFDKSTEEGDNAHWCLASSPCDQHIVDYVSESKLLRAAMIVFLMMQDARNEK